MNPLVIKTLDALLKLGDAEYSQSLGHPPTGDDFKLRKTFYQVLNSTPWKEYITLKRCNLITIYDESNNQRHGFLSDEGRRLYTCIKAIKQK